MATRTIDNFVLLRPFCYDMQLMMHRFYMGGTPIHVHTVRRACWAHKVPDGTALGPAHIQLLAWQGQVIAHSAQAVHRQLHRHSKQ